MEEKIGGGGQPGKTLSDVNVDDAGAKLENVVILASKKYCLQLQIVQQRNSNSIKLDSGSSKYAEACPPTEASSVAGISREYYVMRTVK